MTNKEIREKIWNCFKGYQQEYISESNIDQIMQIVEEECEKAFKEGEKIGI